MRKFALSGLVAVAAVLGSAIPAATAAASTSAPWSPAPARIASAVAHARGATRAFAGTAASTATTATTSGAGALGARISCLPAAPTCLEVGENLNAAGHATPTAAVLHGTTWKAITVKAPGGAVSAELTGVSCPATNYCLVTGDWVNTSGLDQTYDLIWNGTVFGALGKAPIPSGDTMDYPANVSCVAVKSCVLFQPVTEASGNLATLVWTWNGSSWGLSTPAVATGTMPELTTGHCFSLTSCIEAGLTADSAGAITEVQATWNGTTLTTQTIYTASSGKYAFPSGMSCHSTTSCAVSGEISADNATSVTGSAALTQIWNGTSWKTSIWPGPGGSTFALMVGVSCTTPGYCVAAGTAGNSTSFAATSLIWNGVHWSPLSTPSIGKGIDSEFATVSCTATAHCVAFGLYGAATSSGTPLGGYLNGSSWKLVHA